ncbi:MAG: hypothetical protein V7L00_25325 [Nostoc sp.]|uniref:hypothetical protein n=1 Tax=Nostoc sp. TaxID=1180 RepID=UPI002FFAB528
MRSPAQVDETNDALPIVILGGGFAGLFAALHLRDLHSGPIILIDPNLTYTQDQVDSLSGSVLLVTCLCLAAGIFYIGVCVARRHTRHHQLIAIRLRQIQTLERIWQMTAKRRD